MGTYIKTDAPGMASGMCRPRHPNLQVGTLTIDSQLTTILFIEQHGPTHVPGYVLHPESRGDYIWRSRYAGFLLPQLTDESIGCSRYHGLQLARSKRQEDRGL